MGQAVGTAAAFAVRKEILPTDIYHKYLKDYQQILLREDGSVLGVKNDDPNDLARKANVEVSNELTEINTYGTDAEVYALNKSIAFTLPVNPKIEDLSLLVKTKQSTSLKMKWYKTGNPQNYIPHELIGQQTVTLPSDYTGWQKFSINWSPDQPQNMFVIVEKNSDCSVYLGHEEFAGVLSYIDNPIAELSQPELHDYSRKSPLLYWTNQLINRRNFVFKVDHTLAFKGTNIVNGYVRPYGGPNMWVTNMKFGPEYINLTWNKEQEIQQINLTFNDDVNEDIINLHHHRTYFNEVPELVKDYQIQYEKDGKWIEIERNTNNRVRHIVRKLDQKIKTKKVRINIFQTNGSSQISVNEVRVY